MSNGTDCWRDITTEPAPRSVSVPPPLHPAVPPHTGALPRMAPCARGEQIASQEAHTVPGGTVQGTHPGEAPTRHDAGEDNADAVWVPLFV